MAGKVEEVEDAMSKGEQPLRSISDFQRFCADLRKRSLSLDTLVQGLRDLAEAPLRASQRARFAHSIAGHLRESVDVSELLAVAALDWPPEIAMALHSPVAAQGDPTPPIATPLTESPQGVDLRELARERGSPPTVVFLGHEDEHRDSTARLKKEKIDSLRIKCTQELRHALEREAVAGIVIGASWWAIEDPRQRSPRQRLCEILQMSNICWIKLVRSPAWASAEDDIYKLCTEIYFSHPPGSRFTIEDQSTITTPELKHLNHAIGDIFFADGSFSYDSPVSATQDRILRAASSRYLSEVFSFVPMRNSAFRVRTLANRGEHRLVCLVSVVDTGPTFVIKVSPYQDAHGEAQRFRLFALGITLDMKFFCHGTHGALIFKPINEHMGDARSLETTLSPRGSVSGGSMDQNSIPPIESAIAALQRFSEQSQSKPAHTFCSVEYEDTEKQLEIYDSIIVAGEAVDLRWVYARGLEALHRCADKQVVQHGDAHPGNILFTAAETAILIDYECAGLAPACYDFSMLWIHVLASRFIAVGDERATVAMLRDLLMGIQFVELQETWAKELRFAVSQEAVFLASRAISASLCTMAKHGYTREDVYGIVALILCRELLNSEFQQFTMRCALAAASSMLRESPS